MSSGANAIDAVKLIIMTGDWDTAGEFADENNVVDCLRCFQSPRRMLFSETFGAPYLCLFCANCWFEHLKHKKRSRGRAPAQCEICNVIGAHRSMDEALAVQKLHSAERRFLGAFGWTRNGATWDPPKDQNFKYENGYTHNHAVNALKQRQGLANQPRQPQNPRWRPRDDE